MYRLTQFSFLENLNHPFNKGPKIPEKEKRMSAADTHFLWRTFFGLFVFRYFHVQAMSFQTRPVDLFDDRISQ